MSKTEASRFVECVQGEIIGDSWSTGQLYHQGRPQGPQFSGNDAEIRQQAATQVARWKAAYGSVEYTRLYPNGLELRIWD